MAKQVTVPSVSSFALEYQLAISKTTNLADIIDILEFKKAQTPSMEAGEIAQLLEVEAIEVMRVFSEQPNAWWEVEKYSAGGPFRYRLRNKHQYRRSHRRKTFTERGGFEF